MRKFKVFQGGKKGVKIKPIIVETEITEPEYAERFMQRLNSKPDPDAYVKNQRALDLFRRATDR